MKLCHMTSCYDCMVKVENEYNGCFDNIQKTNRLSTGIIADLETKVSAI